ncbi:FmdB family zinc ribbon protein [Chloroflexota bacterium]
MKNLPVYEYECTCCSSRFELKQSFSENTAVFCPQCGGGTQRVLSPPLIIFKGPGFYSTDSRQNHNRSSHESGTDEAKAGSTEKGS